MTLMMVEARPTLVSLMKQNLNKRSDAYCIDFTMMYFACVCV